MKFNRAMPFLGVLKVREGSSGRIAGMAIVVLSSLPGCGNEQSQTPTTAESQVNVFRHQQSVSGSPTPYLTTSTVFIRTPGGEQCTGSIVSSTRIITAHHCSVDGLNGSAYTLEFGTDIANMSVKMRGRGVVRQHPDSDIATIDFERPLPSGYSPVPILPENTLKKGDRVVVAGFGVTAERPDGGYQPPRYLRWGYMMFNNWKAQINLPLRSGGMQSYRSVLEFLPDDRGTVVCSGDSGGPVYAQHNGAWGLAGILSASDCANRSSSADPRPNVTWIFSN